MGWVDKTLRTTNDVARVLKGGPLRLPLRARADAANELCDRYHSLLIDPSFRRDIVEAAAFQERNQRTLTNLKSNITALRCHTDATIALLIEAGADATFALEAVRSVEQAVTGDAHLGGMKPEEFFRDLLQVKEAVCRLSAELRAQTAQETRTSLLRKAAVGGVSLLVVGLSASALAAIATVGPLTAGALAVTTAIGTTGFSLAADDIKKLL
jgi:hypothetical protein